MEQTHFDKDRPGTLTSLGHYSISYIADTPVVTEHYHNCYKVVVSLDHEFDCIIDGQVLFGLRCLIVNKTVPHTFFTPDSNMLVNFIKTDSLYGMKLHALLDKKACVDISSVIVAGQADQILPENYRLLPNDILIPYVHAFLNSIFIRHLSDSPVADKRIQLALWYIEDNLNDMLKLKVVAAYINLSSDRTRHLFTQQTGTTFSQYVLWKRIQRTIALTIPENGRFNEICLQFGFTDQAHFNHSFKRIFGLTPRNMIRNNRFLL